MDEREAEGVVRLNHNSPDEYLSKLKSDEIDNMGLLAVLTLLRKFSAAEPEIEEYNWTTLGNCGKRHDPVRDRRFIEAFQKGLVMAALRRLNELLQLTQADIEAVLCLKPIFDSLTVEQFWTWNGWEPMELPDGGQVLHVPYPEYHPVVGQWTNAVCCTPFYIDPYRDVPGKEGGVPPPRFLGLGERSGPTPEQFFADADLDEVRQYMSLCFRGEHFCDGHIASEFERGVIQAAFQRLEIIHRCEIGWFVTQSEHTLAW